MSRYAFWLCAALILGSALLYYPKWRQPHSEATISWDVAGYYTYLPATLIYGDITRLEWWQGIEEKYRPGPGMGQAFKHPSGNYVMKYPMGQALQFLPWFLTAHALAVPLGYPADGFSLPYQAAISWGSLLVALIGLWFLRRVLLNYFSEGVTAAVLISLAFGSNYLEYAGITGAMTHNWLFTLNAILIFLTIRFYRSASVSDAVLIGLLVGWATLTRPTEIISLLIPVFWGVHSRATLRERRTFFTAHGSKILLSVLTAGAVMFLQAAYWKYASGDWIVYSYEKQGFTWLPPHIEDVLWSAKAGWLVYSPMMLFAVAGLFMLRKCRPEVFPTVAGYCLIALYITAAWDIWWYGGSLGQRAMVQAYPLWAFCLGAFWTWVTAQNWRVTVFTGLAALCIYLNLWWSHQAHRGGLFIAEQMTRRYMLKVLGRFETDRDWIKFLDTRDEYTGGDRLNIREVLNQNFDNDTTAVTSPEKPLNGSRSLLLSRDNQFSPAFRIPYNPDQPFDWCRASATFRCEPKEWDWWAMTQFVVRFRSGDKTVRERMIRLQRLVDGGEVKQVYFDVKKPKEPFDVIEVLFWNAGSNKNIRIDEVRLEVFNEG